jgi:hypothetical protein
MTGQVILILVVGGQATLVSFLKNKQNKTKNQSNTYGYMAKDLCCYATLIKYVWLYGQGPVLLRHSHQIRMAIWPRTCVVTTLSSNTYGYMAKDLCCSDTLNTYGYMAKDLCCYDTLNTYGYMAKDLCCYAFSNTIVVMGNL